MNKRKSMDMTWTNSGNTKIESCMRWLYRLEVNLREAGEV